MIISYEIHKGVVQSVAHVIGGPRIQTIYFNSHDSNFPWLLLMCNHRRYHFNILPWCIENEIDNLQTRLVLLQFIFLMDCITYGIQVHYDTLFKYRAYLIFVVFYLSSLFFDLIGTDIFLFCENVDVKT